MPRLRGLQFQFIKQLKNGYLNFEASEDIITKFTSQTLHTIKSNIKKKVSKSSDKRIENKIFTNECKKNKNIEYVNLDKFKLIPDNICSNRPIGGADIFKISDF